MSDEESGIWIGPTKCDDERTSRQSDIDKVWDIVKPMLQGNNFKISTYSVVWVAIDLFREAMNCYQNGAYLATCSMCRVCSECLLYLSVTRRATSDREVVEIREDLVREKRKVFLNSAIKDGLVNNEEESTSIQEIWDKGDFAMHIHQKLDIGRREWARLVSSGHIPPEGSISKGWSERSEALVTMTETATVLSKIMGRLNSLRRGT